MKIETSHLEDHQVKLTVEVESSSLENTKYKAARKIARQIKIPGFRPGKAPFSVVVRQVGEALVLEEAIELLVEEIYPEVIKTAEIEPYGPGSLEKIISTDPPKFEFLVPLKATVELGDYKAVRESYEPEGINEEDVEEIIENLRTQNAVVEPVERAAQQDDWVRVLVHAHIVGEADTEPLIRERPLSVLIKNEDAEVADEWPFPGFSRHLIGMLAGGKKEIIHKFDDSSPYEIFRNIEATFIVEMTDVRSRTLPTEDDEFAQSVGEFTTMAELRRAIRNDLASHSLANYDEAYDDKVFGMIAEISTIKYPPQMLEKEIDDIIHNISDRLERQGLSMDLYLKSRQLDMEGLREETRPVGVTRLRKTLVLLEIAEAENIQIEPQELQTETERTLGEAYRVLPENEYRKLVKQENASNLVSNVMMDMLIKKTHERVRFIARGEGESVEPSSDEVESPQEGEQADLEVEIAADMSVADQEKSEQVSE